MLNNSSIWFMEGVSSQRDILAAVRAIRDEGQHSFDIIASHRDNRPEILAEADHAYLEPKDKHSLLAFMSAIIRKHHVVAVQAGKRGAFFETLRPEIEAMGVKLTTGALDKHTFDIADDKAQFSVNMTHHGLASVPSVLVTTPEEFSVALASPLFSTLVPCIKPVRGIYGMGFWILNKTARRMQCFGNPDERIVHPDIFISALRSAAEAGETMAPQIVMPWLPGPERSVDMLVENGNVLAAVARCKTGSVQSLENAGPAFDLAIACAEKLRLDGLVNVQTRNDAHGQPVLLEANLRPSGGIGYTLHCGINLSGMFALRQLGLLTDAQIRERVARFTALQVTPSHQVMPVPVCQPGSPDFSIHKHRACSCQN